MSNKEFKVIKVIENGKEYYVLYRSNGDIIYHKNEGLTIMHREKGPAVQWYNGHKEWFINGKYHREDGPAVEYTSGSKEWWINGERHRIDGPAIMCAFDAAIDGLGRKFYYLNGVRYKEEDYWSIVKLGSFV